MIPTVSKIALPVFIMKGRRSFYSFGIPRPHWLSKKNNLWKCAHHLVALEHGNSLLGGHSETAAGLQVI